MLPHLTRVPFGGEGTTELSRAGDSTGGVDDHVPLPRIRPRSPRVCSRSPPRPADSTEHIRLTVTRAPNAFADLAEGRKRTDASGRADDHAACGLHVPLVTDGPKSGSGQSRRVREGEARSRFGNPSLSVAHRELGGTSLRRGHHLVTAARVRDVCSDRLHRSRDVHPGECGLGRDQLIASRAMYSGASSCYMSGPQPPCARSTSFSRRSPVPRCLGNRHVRRAYAVLAIASRRSFRSLRHIGHATVRRTLSRLMLGVRRRTCQAG